MEEGEEEEEDTTTVPKMSKNLSCFTWVILSNFITYWVVKRCIHRFFAIFALHLMPITLNDPYSVGHLGI